MSAISYGPSIGEKSKNENGQKSFCPGAILLQSVRATCVPLSTRESKFFSRICTRDGCGLRLRHMLLHHARVVDAYIVQCKSAHAIQRLSIGASRKHGAKWTTTLTNHYAILIYFLPVLDTSMSLAARRHNILSVGDCQPRPPRRNTHFQNHDEDNKGGNRKQEKV